MGQLCAEDAFTSQFIGKAGPFALGDNVDAVSGATITSTAVVDAVNELLAAQPAAEASAESPAEAAPAGVLSLTRPGFGDLDVVVSLTRADDGTVATLSVDASTQTPGLGQLCAEDAFTSQFVGKAAPFTLGENIDAVSGATITSTAVVDAVNELLAQEEPAPAEDSSAETAPAAAGLTPNVSFDHGVYTVSVPGFNQKDVQVRLTLDENRAVSSLQAYVSTQTPDLGQRCGEASFTSQFIGKSAPFVLGENIDAVTNATITSSAIVDAVNAILESQVEPTAPVVVSSNAKVAPSDKTQAEEASASISLQDGTYTAVIPAYNGKDITVTLTLADDHSITDVQADVSSQTPDLGQRCAEPAFIGQFAGKTGPFTLGENIDAQTNATVTSSAIVKAVNDILTYAEGATADAPSAAETQDNSSSAAPSEGDIWSIARPGYNNQDVTVSLTLAADGTIETLTVDASTQTPDLGQRCAEEAFTSQFIGKTAPFTAGDNVDVVTNATITSTAVIGAVNELLAGQQTQPVSDAPAPAESEEAAEEKAELTMLTLTKPGYDGLDVTVSLAKAEDGTVAELTVDASTQTPGLGQKCAEEAFTSQFIGKAAPFTLGENVDAVSGATMTSTAVVEAVNELLADQQAMTVSEAPAPAAIEEAVEEKAELSTLTLTKPGYDGLDVTVSIVKAEDGTVAELTVDASTQTPGLGQKCAEEAFTSQFVGKAAPFTLGENVDAVSGATMTSTAVVEAVNELLADQQAMTVSEAPAPAAIEEAVEEKAELSTLTLTKPGYDGLDVTVSLAKAEDGTVAELTVDASTQTPGLGQKCAEEAFTSQFVGKAAPFTLGENVDAVSGATMTSTAVVEAVNELLAVAPAEQADAAPVPKSGAVSLTVPAFNFGEIIVSLTSDNGAVTSLDVNTETQTFGLGQKCSEADFTSQFVGKTAPFTLGENVDAVSGATITSQAVVDAVNEMLK